MANFLTGSYIEVLYTDNTVARFPHQIGCLGIVEHAPIHPSTWFTIKMMDGRSIKLQTTAMKHVSKSDSRHQMAQNILLLPAQKQSIVVHAAPTGKFTKLNFVIPFFCKITNKTLSHTMFQTCLFAQIQLLQTYQRRIIALGQIPTLVSLISPRVSP